MSSLIWREDVFDAIHLSDFIRDDEYENGATLIFKKSLIDRVKDIPPATTEKEIETYSSGYAEGFGDGLKANDSEIAEHLKEKITDKFHEALDADRKLDARTVGICLGITHNVIDDVLEDEENKIWTI